MYGAPFHKEASRNNNISSITNWVVVEVPFLKRLGTDLPIKDILCYPKRGGTLCHSFRIIFKHFSFCIRPRTKSALNKKNDRLY